MSGSKNKQANAIRGQKLQHQMQLVAARENDEAAAHAFSLQAFAQPNLGQQGRAMTGGEMVYPVSGASGPDPRVEFYLMQRNQQERLNELAVLEQQRLASLDPDFHMRLLRGGSAYHGFPPGMNANLLGQQMSFNQRLDPSNNTTAASFMNDMMTMRHPTSQQQNIGAAQASWIHRQQQQQQIQQQDQQHSSGNNPTLTIVETHGSGQSKAPDGQEGN